MTFFPEGVKILDCTIRDGGYLNNWNFDKADVRKIYHSISRAGVDIVEIGFKTPEKYYNKNEYGLWRFCEEKDLIDVTKDANGAKLGVMIDFGKHNLKEIPEKDNSVVDIIRVAAHKNKISSALNLAEHLKDKGYQTSIQMMGYSTFTDEGRRNVADVLESTFIDYVYVADSYGSILPFQIKELLEPLLEIPNIKIGFHPHNSLEMAFANTIEAINCGVHIIDGSIYGMGRGAGNMPIEAIIAYSQLMGSTKYNIVPILELIHKYFMKFKKSMEWGYQMSYMLSGMFNCHPYYAKGLIEREEYTIQNIWDALKGIQNLKPIGFKKEILEKGLELIKTKQEYIEKKPKIVALMPMKAHSERIPNKNIRIFNGKPLYTWMLSKLANSPFINKVVVDTDSNLITNEIKRTFPEVKVIERPKELRGDFVAMNDIILHDVSIEDADIYLQAHSTSPLLRKRTIELAIKKFLKYRANHDSLFGVTAIKKMFWDEKGKPINHDIDKLIRTQDLPPVYEENSSIYIFTKESMLKNRRRIGNTPYMFEIPHNESIDIDEMLDFRVAEAIHKMRHMDEV